MKNDTIDWYDRNATSYFNDTYSLSLANQISRLTIHLRPGARVLDVGCGSGRDCLAFRSLGFDVEARDASEGMARATTLQTGISVTVADVRETHDVAAFDGIWASAILLHIEPNEVPSVMIRISNALRPGGVLYVSLKEGTGSELVDGRWFHYWCLEDFLREAVSGTRLSLIESWKTEDTRRAGVIWINMLFSTPKEGPRVCTDTSYP